MRVTVLLLALCCAIVFAAASNAVAAQTATSHKPLATSYGTEAISIPQMLSYQGSLTDTLGQPVPDGSYILRFRLYTEPSGGGPFWTESQNVNVRGGLFHVMLGAVSPIYFLPDSGGLYLGLQVASDPELSPRLRIVSAAYAYVTERAAGSDRLQGKDTTAFVRTGQSGSITSVMIVDSTIAAADLGPMDADSGQVMKWDGSAWVASNDSAGQSSGGTVMAVSQAPGVVCTPNPIVDSGTVGFDSAWGDTRFVNEGQANSVTDSMIVDGAVTPAKIYLPYSASVATTSDAFEVSNTQTNSDAAALVGTHDVTDAYGVGVRAVGGAVGLAAYVTPDSNSTYFGVHSDVTGGSGQNYGVLGSATGAGMTYGVYGNASGSGTNYGVFGDAGGSGTNYAGYFNGNVTVTGTLSKGGGSFQIDHPLDPLDKYLFHSFVESPDMLNIYNGEAVLDASGRAQIELPLYFEVLNRNPRIQLTGVGSSDVYVVQEVTGNRFTIGGKPGVKVFWQVTGIRQDPYANSHRIQVEVDKPANERGKYLHPDAYGLTREAGIGYMSKPDDAKAKAARQR